VIAAGVSQRKAAKALGVSKSALNRDVSRNGTKASQNGTRPTKAERRAERERAQVARDTAGTKGVTCGTKGVTPAARDVGHDAPQAGHDAPSMIAGTISGTRATNSTAVEIAASRSISHAGDATAHIQGTSSEYNRGCISRFGVVLHFTPMGRIRRFGVVLVIAALTALVLVAAVVGIFGWLVQL